MPQSMTDVHRLLGATLRASERLSIPVISMAMGGLGAVTRLAGGVYGSAPDLCRGLAPSAPGQSPSPRCAARWPCCSGLLQAEEPDERRLTAWRSGPCPSRALGGWRRRPCGAPWRVLLGLGHLLVAVVVDRSLWASTRGLRTFCLARSLRGVLPFPCGGRGRAALSSPGALVWAMAGAASSEASAMLRVSAIFFWRNFREDRIEF